MKLPTRILVLSPHTDDGELGAGGTMAKHIEEGGEVFYVALSAAEKSLPPDLPRDALRIECTNANKTLGVPAENIQILNYEVRTFPSHRQEILDDLIELRKRLNPDLVLVPSSNDVHQDHGVVFMEALRTFKTCSSIWGYEHPWNNLTFTTDVLVSLTLKQINKKISALKSYDSQISKGRQYFDEEYLFGILKTHGTQAGFQFAEAFELIRQLVY